MGTNMIAIGGQYGGQGGGELNTMLRRPVRSHPYLNPYLTGDVAYGGQAYGGTWSLYFQRLEFPVS